jgi:selenocysteine-specific translation elongation factor
MNSLNIFTYDVNDFLKTVSKKATESDITLYNRKDGENIFSFLSPTRFPEKIPALTDCIYPADVAIVNGNNLTRELGEVIIALDLMGLKRGYFLVDDESKIDQLKPVISKTSLKDFRFYSGNHMEFMDILSKEKHVPRFSKPTIVIDHFFKVKSVGTVALGFVLGGKVEKHQKLMCSYADKEAQIKSIQVQDEDQESVESGTRVGLALKNIDADEIERGMFMSEGPFEYLTEFQGKFEFHPAVKGLNDASFEIFVADQMRYQRGVADRDKFTLEKPVVKMKNELVVATPNKTPRIQGKIRIS